MVYHGVLWFITVYLVCFGVFRCILVCFGVFLMCYLAVSVCFGDWQADEVKPEQHKETVDAATLPLLRGTSLLLFHC